jgi:hypothetical protein
MAKEVLADFSNTGAGEQLADVEVGHGGLHAGAILDGGGDSAGEGSTNNFPAMGAKFAFGEEFGDEHFDVRQIKYLAGFD